MRASSSNHKLYVKNICINREIRN